MKRIVYENLLEFQRGQDPFDALSLGRLKEIKEWLKPYIFTSNYTINDDWTINIKKDLIFINKYHLVEFPPFIQFYECFDSFIFRDANLKSMRGCPKIIWNDFFVDGNKLEDLEGCPLEVKGDFYINRNKEAFSEEQIRKVCKIDGKLKV